MLLYFEGDAAENLEFDQEAYDVWKSLIDQTHIFKRQQKR
jgi:hypothetical protein